MSVVCDIKNLGALPQTLQEGVALLTPSREHSPLHPFVIYYHPKKIPLSLKERGISSGVKNRYYWSKLRTAEAFWLAWDNMD